MKRALAAVLLLASACSTGDLCAGYDGACIGLTVNGATPVEYLHFSLLSLPVGSFTTANTAVSKDPIDLPVTTALHLGPSDRGSLRLMVTGFVGAATSGSATIDVDVEGNAHLEETVTLELPDAGAARDLSVGHEPGDGGEVNVDGGLPKGAPCPPSANLDCETFDGPLTLSTTCAGGTIGVNDTDAWSGGSLQVNVAANSSCFGSKPLPMMIDSGPVWVRFYVNGSVPFGGAQSAAYFFAFDDNDGVGVVNNSTQTNTWSPIPQAPTIAPAIPFVPNEWHCVKLEVQFAIKTLTATIDGGPAIVAMQPAVVAPITMFSLGIDSTSTPAGEFLFDDLAIGNLLPIDCE